MERSPTQIVLPERVYVRGLEALLSRSQCDFVFTHPSDPTEPLSPWVLESQIGQLKKKINAHVDAGLHAMRHTFLTETGEYTDPFTLQYVAGHDNIKTTMRYVHPQANAVHKLFVRLSEIDREKMPVGIPSACGRCKIRCSWIEA
jgi:integrase